MGRHNQDIFYPGLLYHIYNKVVTGEKLFKKDEDYWQFMKRYAKYFSPYFVTYAYCLIPNHFHFLIRVKDEDEIKKNILAEDTNAARKYLRGDEEINFFLEHQFSRWLSGIAMKYNNRNNRVGPLFKQGTKRVALNAYRTFQQQMHYIHLNPKHHFLVNDIEDWKHSSYSTYISGQETKLPRREVFEKFGGEQGFIKFHQNTFNGDIDFD